MYHLRYKTLAIGNYFILQYDTSDEDSYKIVFTMDAIHYQFKFTGIMDLRDLMKFVQEIPKFKKMRTYTKLDATHYSLLYNPNINEDDIILSSTVKFGELTITLTHPIPVRSLKSFIRSINK